MLISTLTALAILVGTLLAAGRRNSRPQAVRIPVRIRDHRSKRN
jgi:hypothetical protein